LPEISEEYENYGLLGCGIVYFVRWVSETPAVSTFKADRRKMFF
jgi:hypothetical protein